MIDGSGSGGFFFFRFLRHGRKGEGRGGKVGEVSCYYHITFEIVHILRAGFK